MTDLVHVALIAATPPTIVSLGALIASISNHQKIQELHVIVNSRLSELLSEGKKASFAEGRAEGVKETK
jgi:uncharacterized protein YbgA (DUF1722 family)